jgi:hypothetical protein
MSAVHSIKFPFIREKYSGPLDGEIVDDVDTWRPGTRREWSEGEYDTEEWFAADGEGFMVLEELGSFKPGRFPERTFYLRRFIDPAGKQFGKDKVRVIASSAFRRMLKGYRHSYELPEATQ